MLVFPEQHLLDCHVCEVTSAWIVANLSEQIMIQPVTGNKQPKHPIRFAKGGPASAVGRRYAQGPGGQEGEWG